jgi:hypothetical protein
VWVTGVEAVGKAHVTASMVVELPSEAAARQGVIALCNEAAECGVSDAGQRFVGLALD